MAKFAIFLLLAIIKIASGTSPPIYQTCPPNEVYSECGNHGCQNTCANPNIAKVCRAACTPGCICIGNYLRNTKGVCVPYKNCDTCKANEIFDLCGNTRFANTCAEPNLSLTTPEDVCDAGCICRPGYVRNDKKDCIKLEDCPKCKGPNEFFSCGSPCDTECATLGEICPIVNIKCTERCYCKEGFARNSAGVCIPVNDCPPRQCKDDPNAIIVPCGDPCPLTCENKDDPGPRPCAAICIVNGCKCKDGYVKDKAGKCTLAKNCPPVSVPPLKCRTNEIFDPCTKDCPPQQTCYTYMSGLKVKCVPSDVCKPACRCLDGYIKNEKGFCITPNECCKDPNAELVRCANPCSGGTCAKPEFDPCKIKCPYYGCQCKKGYLKKSDTDPTCILKTKCPYPVPYPVPNPVPY